MLVAAFLLAATAARGVEIVRVWPEWRSDDSFVRISELLDGKENPGNEIFLRTQPKVRDGMYFLVRLAHAAQMEASFELSLIMPGSPDPVHFRFPASLRDGSSVFQLGLTGSDWPDSKQHAVAWRVALKGVDGGELATAQSFLWAKAD